MYSCRMRTGHRNPQAQVAKFDGINLSEVENNLVEAVRAIKQYM